MELHQQLECVRDRASFFNFVRELASDRKQAAELETENPSSPYGSDVGGWENSTIESYLDAALAWAEDSAETTQGLSQNPSWKEFATFLYVGKIYE